MSISKDLKHLEDQGFYKGIGVVYSNPKVIYHDVYDHLYYPRINTCCPWKFKVFIPPSPEGEVWAQVNSLSKIILWKGNMPTKSILDNVNTFADSINAPRLSARLVMQFGEECIDFWQQESMQSKLQEYIKMMKKYF